MSGFTKLFPAITSSSIWLEAYPTRILWVAMLAHAGQDGTVEASPRGLASLAGITQEECAVALNVFMSPDPDSRDRTNNGIKLVRTDSGFKILNYEKYRQKSRSTERKDYQAEYYQKKVETLPPPPQTGFQLDSTVQPIAEAEAEAEKKKDIKPKLRFDLEAIYSLYPRKTGKAEGIAKLQKLIRTQTAYDRVIAGVKAFSASPQGSGDKSYIPHFSTWVNQKRWEDHESSEDTHIGYGNRRSSLAERARQEEAALLGSAVEDHSALSTARYGQQGVLPDTSGGGSDSMEPEGLWDLPDSERVQGSNTEDLGVSKNQGLGNRHG